MTVLTVIAGIKGTIGIILGLLAAFSLKNSEGGFRLLTFLIVFSLGTVLSIVGIIIFLLIIRNKGVQLKKSYVVPIVAVILCMDLTFIGITVINKGMEKYNYSYIELLNNKLPSVMKSDFVQENKKIQNWLESLDEN
ncbi:hypothetical protein [Lysinibacillus sp. OF-1]|uniref:hypothetical protein n=1 Tax=Lysinibacillus sp. OF-1 TaxID=2972483 RepID=UPI00232BBB04|nr:hypothetical protein [Lysinibacillus sp. OF-1]WCH47024.1 hypothetical protein NV349_18580 [Lysinibacillus sp. OF-1]